MNNINNNIKLLLNHAQRVRDFLLDLIFPIECLGCGHEGTWLCQPCLNKLNFKPFNSCFVCKRKNFFGEFCPTCQSKFHLDGIWIAGDYDNPILSQLIRKLKYHFIKNIAAILGDFISRYLKTVIKCEMIGIKRISTDLKISGHPFIDKDNTLIIPVPLHKKRKRWRGFNQAQALAEKIALNFGFALDVKNLVRIKNNKPQVSLKEKERHKNIIGCFTWQGQNLNGQTVILVDDITTTGSTLNECAKILKASGAEEVWGLVAAKG